MVSWIDNSSIKEENKINLGPLAKKISEKFGSFSTGCPCPKLGDFFGAMITPVDFLPHLKAHTAISDALMLYTLIKSNKMK
jgi:hypothetical protein